MSDIRLYRVVRNCEGKHCGNEYIGDLVTCGECKYNKYDLWDDAFFCTNERSENCGCPTFYNDTCDEYEEKE